MEQEVMDAEMVLPKFLPFKRVQALDKYPKGQSRTKHWKHLKQILQAENYQDRPGESNYECVNSDYPHYPPKKYCDITGFEAPYTDPRTNLRFAKAEMSKIIASLPDETVQKYLSLRNAAKVLR